MPINVTCSGCGVSLSTPDSSAGKRAKCPKCGGEILIPEVPRVEPIVEGELFSGAVTEKQRKPCSACGEMIMREAVKCRFCGEVLDSSLKGLLKTSGNVNNPAWLKVRSGVATIYNCIGIIFGTGILIVALAAIMGAMNAGPAGGDEPAALMIVFALGGLVIMGAAIGILVGYVRCTNVPPESTAHGFAVGTVICLVGNVLLSMVGGAVNSEAITGIGSLLSTIGWVLFILFIRRCATYLNDPDLASSAGNFLIYAGVMVVGGLALGVLAALGNEVLLGLVALGAIVGGLVGFVWFLRLLRGLMTTIDLRLETQTSFAPFA